MRTLSLLLILALAILPGCRRYPQDSPQAVLLSARKMIAEHHAERLTDLIYADSKEFRTLLNQLGQTLGALEDLGLAVHDAYPKEIAKLKRDAEEAAKSGRASSYVQQIVGQATASMQQGAGGRRRGPQIPDGDTDEFRKTFDNALKEVFADPYGWLAQSEERLTVQTVTDEQAAILWDGKPIFGVGLMMRLDKGKWFVDVPLYAPPMNQILPKSQEGWEVLGGLFQVFDQAFTDLTDDVKAGKARRLEDLAARAGDKMFLPAAMVGFAYVRLMDIQRKEQREAAKAAGATGPSGGAVQFKMGGGRRKRGEQNGVSVQIGTEPRKETPAPESPPK